jgi:hypothetical protein
MSSIPASSARPEGQHRIWCGDTAHPVTEPCEISHLRERANVLMTQAGHEVEPTLTVSVTGRPWPLTVDVLAAQDVVLTLTLALEHLARIGITAS